MNKLLNQIRKSKTNSCRICKSNPESIYHLFVNCDSVKNLWKDLNDQLQMNIGKRLNKTPFHIILGYLNNDSNFLPINTILLVTKFYIFMYAVTLKYSNLKILMDKMKTCYDEQYMLSMELDKEDNFKKNWTAFIKIFCSI